MSFAAPDAGTRAIPKLVSTPKTAIAIITSPMSGRLCFHMANMAPPTEVPKMIAMNVLISKSPLPRESSFSGSISGRMPYLAGLKKAAWSPIKNTIPSMDSICPVKNAPRDHPLAVDIGEMPGVA